MPDWLTQEQRDEIVTIYADARRLTEETGVEQVSYDFSPTNINRTFEVFHVPVMGHGIHGKLR